ncbi:alcohol dehydrogenase catalytic domain-containing protein [Streptococcus agalactiae]|uniref:alcohol dehydrogenase catalytic domain-containing protein n=1 Tax=Streptococcus agalactiae TaxID=1311 RepID=UPI00178C28DB|nr:alcohol dehydrogenase catalytic domain-containing protein [Streptococcus agalactiae]
MKAVVVNQASTGVEVVEHDLPKVGHGEALVKVEYCGVCHTDLHVAHGDFGQVPGRILGHEGIGIVEEIGEGVTSLRVGDRVSIAWFFEGCGHCEYCTTGRETLCRSVKNAGYSVDGGMSEYAVVTADYAVKVPEGLDPAQASSITCAGVTTYKAIKEAGADLTVNGKEIKDVAAYIQEKTGGCHGVVVTAVSKVAFNQAIDSVRAGGTVVAVGLPSEYMELSIVKTVLDGIRVVGSLVGTRKDLEEAFAFGAEGLVVPVVEKVPVDTAPQVFDEMERGLIQGRKVLDFTK